MTAGMVADPDRVLFSSLARLQQLLTVRQHQLDVPDVMGPQPADRPDCLEAHGSALPAGSQGTYSQPLLPSDGKGGLRRYDAEARHKLLLSKDYITLKTAGLAAISDGHMTTALGILLTGVLRGAHPRTHSPPSSPPWRLAQSSLCSSFTSCFSPTPW